MDTTNLTQLSLIHGTVYAWTPSLLDLMIIRHLPASLRDLRIKVEEVVGRDCANIKTTTELLIILCDAESQPTQE